MIRAKTISQARAAKQLIPISQLVKIPEGIAIPFDHLEIADLSDLRRGVTLVTSVGPSIKVLITRSAGLSVTVVCRVDGNDALAQKYGIEAVARTMSHATGVVPVDQEKAKRLPSITSASWKLPDEVTWLFDLPATTTGAGVLTAVRASDEFIVRTTEALLTQETKVQKQAEQN